MDMTFKIDDPTRKTNEKKLNDGEEEFRQRFIQEKGVVIIGVELSIKDLWILMFKVAIATLPISIVFLLILGLLI